MSLKKKKKKKKEKEKNEQMKNKIIKKKEKRKKNERKVVHDINQDLSDERHLQLLRHNRRHYTVYGL